MSSNISTASRAHRTLRRLQQYQMGQNCYKSLSQHGLVLDSNEQFLGAYSNSSNQIDETVVVTDLGLRIRKGDKWIRVNFGQIEKAVIPGEKQKASEIYILRKDRGPIVVVPVRGQQGKIRDIFEFLRFLNRTVEDTNL